MRTKNVFIKPMSAIATSVLLLAGNLTPVIANGDESAEQCGSYDVVYNFGTCQKGKEIVLTPHCNHEHTGVDAGMMEVSKLELVKEAPDWATIDSNGIITCKPGEEVDSKTYLITALVTYNDGTQEYTTTRVCVMDEVKEEISYAFETYVLDYKEITMKVEETASTSLNCLDIFGTPATLPEGTTFDFADTTVPSWITIDEAGNITAQPTSEDEDQTVVGVVDVTYTDDSSDAIVFVVNVEKKEDEKEPEPEPIPEAAMADQYEPSYPDSKFVKTDSATIDIKYATETPSEVTYTLSDAPEWVSLNETTGQLTVTGSESIVAGNYGGKVVVTYVDGTMDEVIFNLEMTEKDVVVVESIKVNPESLKLAPSQTSKLSVEITPTTAETKITYSSLDNSIATVSDDGVVKAIKEGKTTIVARSENGKTASCTVEVTEGVVKVQAIRLDKEYVSTEVGKTYRLKYVLSPENANEDVKVTWSVDDPSILTVDQDGRFKTLKKGTATITVKTDTGLTASCKVKVLKKGDVDTGTNTNSAFYIGGAIIAGIALIALLVLGRKKK